jgi:hypothetical protein
VGRFGPGERLACVTQAHDPPGIPRLVDAAALAEILGVTRPTVYAHAEELGAIRIGRGARARLRFDPARAISANAEAAITDPVARPRRPRRRPHERSPSGSRLLPIRVGGAKEALIKA